jgi:hypothetical protein
MWRLRGIRARLTDAAAGHGFDGSGASSQFAPSGVEEASKTLPHQRGRGSSPKHVTGSGGCPRVKERRSCSLPHAARMSARILPSNVPNDLQTRCSSNFINIGALVTTGTQPIPADCSEEEIDEEDDAGEAQAKEKLEVKQDEHLNLFVLDRRVRRYLASDPDALSLYKSAVQGVISSYSLIAPYREAEIVGEERGGRLGAGRKDVETTKRLTTLVNSFVDVAQRFVVVARKRESPSLLPHGAAEEQCAECGEPLEDRGTILWCPDCSLSVPQRLKTDAPVPQEASSSTLRNMNDKLNHFRLIPQLFQGQEDIDIEEEDISTIEAHAARFDIDLDTVTKDTLLHILDQTNLSKKLKDHINLLHHTITGVPPPDISHLEEHILARHQELLLAYTQEQTTGRKYTLKNWYLFFQYLRMEEWDVEPRDLPLVRLKETLDWHNQTMKHLCAVLREQGSHFTWKPVIVTP